MIQASAGGTAIRQELNVELQWNCSDKGKCPGDDNIRQWAVGALVVAPKESPLRQPVSGSESQPELVGEVSIRIVDGPEMQSANLQWRSQNKTTNVLSFPADFPAETGLKYYGDLLICAPVVHLESQQQGKSADAHWAHMVVHGMLHLQGYDHIDDHDATEMEQCEVAILAGLGFSNPYEPVSGPNTATMVSITEVEKN